MKTNKKNILVYALAALFAFGIAFSSSGIAVKKTHARGEYHAKKLAKKPGVAVAQDKASVIPIPPQSRSVIPPQSSKPSDSDQSGKKAIVFATPPAPKQKAVIFVPTNCTMGSVRNGCGSN